MRGDTDPKMQHLHRGRSVAPSQVSLAISRLGLIEGLPSSVWGPQLWVQDSHSIPISTSTLPSPHLLPHHHICIPITSAPPSPHLHPHCHICISITSASPSPHLHPHHHICIPGSRRGRRGGEHKWTPLKGMIVHITSTGQKLDLWIHLGARRVGKYLLYWGSPLPSEIPEGFLLKE